MFQLKQVHYKDILTVEALSIPKAQVTCIVGPSGSGKSTLLKLLNCIISPDSGEILYQNQALSTLDPVTLRRQVVMLPQQPVIFPGTIEENLQIGRQFAQKEAVSKEQLEATLKLVQLKQDLSKSATKLSGGEQQRIALARILLLEPDVFLLDEPSSALDAETEHLIVEALVNHIKDTDQTLIMVTHSKAVADTYGQHIVTLEKGQVLNNGGSDHE